MPAPLCAARLAACGLVYLTPALQIGTNDVWRDEPAEIAERVRQASAAS